jgi:hypothetical protein
MGTGENGDFGARMAQVVLKAQRGVLFLKLARSDCNTLLQRLRVKVETRNRLIFAAADHHKHICASQVL